MATDFDSIPIIDIAPLLDKCDNDGVLDKDLVEVVRMLDLACREAGFFYVKGHGIPESLVNEVRDVTRCFFHLPYEEKLRIKMTAATGFRGYQRIGENITQGKPDMHEAVDCYKEVEPGMYGELGKTLLGSNPWPTNPGKFRPLLEEYIKLQKELARKIMRGIALALGGPADTFEGERAGNSFWVMRLIGYPGATNSTIVHEDDVGCGAHTDYGLLTLVNQDSGITALQVRNRTGNWVSAPPIPGTFVCNIGDMLKVWSNGEYESTLHRVINKSPNYRVSVAFFYEPNFDTPVEPFEFCKKRTGGVAKFSRVVYGEHLVWKVLTNFVD